METLHLSFYSATTPSHFVVVEKKHQQLKLFEQTDNLRLLKEYTCATGQNSGTKKTSGDSRTPEGIYHITEIYEDKRITVFGSRAFHLNYPNIFDTHAGHLGDGIFIHGTNKKLIANSTNGCITLNNSDLEELAPYLAVQSIPVIVIDAESELVLEENLRLDKNSPQFLELLEKVSFNLKTTPVESIKTLSSIKWRDQAVISVTYLVSDDTSTQYNESKRAYLVQSPTGSLRTLYAVQQQDATPKILALQPTKIEPVARSGEGITTDVVAQKTITAPEKPEIPLIKNEKVLAQKKNLKAKPSQPGKSKSIGVGKTRGDELLAFVEKWRTAWVTKDIDTYINCYSTSFKSGDLNRQEWREKKDFLNKKYKYIDVKLKDIVVEWTSSGANVTFQQTYRSDQLHTNGKKTLQLVNRKDRWFIESELI